MKDMDIADVILVIKISKTSEGLVLSQYHYMQKILDKFDKGSDSIAKTPIDPKIHLYKNIENGVS